LGCGADDDDDDDTCAYGNIKMHELICNDKKLLIISVFDSKRERTRDMRAHISFLYNYNKYLFQLIWTFTEL
jgi:hypothetical protein